MPGIETDLILESLTVYLAHLRGGERFPGDPRMDAEIAKTKRAIRHMKDINHRRLCHISGYDAESP